MSSYIVSFVRTPLGKFGKSLQPFSPSDLGAHVIRELINKTGMLGKDIDLVVMGNILKGGHGQDLSRQSLIKAGLPFTVDGYNVDMVCSSGMMSIINASQMVSLGDADIVIAGGIESMSNSNFIVSSKIRYGVKFSMKSDLFLTDSMYYDGLTDPINGMVMGEEADKVAKEHNIKREELDEIAYLSHKKALDAQEKGYLKKEIAPITSGEGVVYNDEGIRPNLKLEDLYKLKPAFGKDGLHTAGSSSQISDGASALLIMNENGLKKTGLKPIAKIIGYSWKGVESWRFTEAPAKAIDILLQKTKINRKEIDYIENNEAFAVSSILLEKDGFDRSITNVFGGAIALGHPIGASGARITGTLINVLQTKGGNLGIAALCHGTGGATSIAVQLI
ncbi:MAG: thiolase family protein [Thermoplasmata archaeon]